MSTNIGSIAATISASADGFTKGVADATASIETFSKSMKKLSNDFAMVSGLVTATAMAMVKSAASINVSAEMGLKSFTQAGQALAVQLSGILMPALDKMTQGIRDLANWFAGLSPVTKQHIADLVVLAAQVLAAALVFGRLMEVVHGVAGVLTTVFGIIAAIGAGPIAMIVTGIVALAVAAAVLRASWTNDWGYLKEIVAGVVTAISLYWTQLVAFLGDIWAVMVDDFANKLKMMIDLFTQFRITIGHADPVLATIQGNVAKNAVDAVGSTAKSPQAIQALVLDAAQAVKAGAKDVIADLRDMAAAAKKKILDELGLNSQGGQAGSGRTKHGGDMDSYSAGVMKDIASALNVGTRVNPVSTANTKVAGTAMDTAEIQKQITESLIEAWDKGDWSGVFDAIGQKISDSLTSVENIMSALKTAGSAFTSATGKLGATINAGIQGGQSGGIWGALIAVIMQFVTQAKGFSQIMNIGNGQFQMALNDLTQGLSGLFSGLSTFMGAIESIAKAIHSILDPILALIGKILSAISGVFEFVGIVLQPLGDIISVIANILGAVLTPILEVLNPLFMAIGEAIMFMKLTIEYTILAFYMFVDALEKIGGGSDQGDITKTQNDIDQTKQDMLDLWNKGLNGVADASANAAAALGATASAAQDVSEQLLNVPQAYKVALAAFQSTATSSTGSANVSSPFSSIGSGTNARRAAFLHTGSPLVMRQAKKK